MERQTRVVDSICGSNASEIGVLLQNKIKNLFLILGGGTNGAPNSRSEFHSRNLFRRKSP